jgi:hypothetical protein
MNRSVRVSLPWVLLVVLGALVALCTTVLVPMRVST